MPFIVNLTDTFSMFHMGITRTRFTKSANSYQIRQALTFIVNIHLAFATNELALEIGFIPFIF